jgi:hypothetical protein
MTRRELLAQLVSGGTKRVPKALRKTAYFLLSASLGAHASIVALAPQRLKYNCRPSRKLHRG